MNLVTADEAKFNIVCKFATNWNINDVRHFWPCLSAAFGRQCKLFNHLQQNPA